MSGSNEEVKEISTNTGSESPTPKAINSNGDAESSVTAVNSMDSPINLDSQEPEDPSTAPKETTSKADPPKKNKGQMTFADFKSIKVVPANEDNGSLRRSHRIKVSALKKKEDDAIKEQKRIHDLEREAEIKKQQPKVKKAKTNKEHKVKVTVKMRLSEQDELKKTADCNR